MRKRSIEKFLMILQRETANGKEIERNCLIAILENEAPEVISELLIDGLIDRNRPNLRDIRNN